MKKLWLVLCLGFVLNIGMLFTSNHKEQVEYNLNNPNSSGYEIKIKNNVIHTKNIDGKNKGITFYCSWPWLPTAQLEKYRNQFIAGVSYE